MGAPEGVGGDGLFELLEGVVGSAGKSPRGNGKSLDDNDLPVFADSKILYTSGHGLEKLERGLWAAWSLLGWELGTWREVWDKLAPQAIAEIDGGAFYCGYDRKLPGDFSKQGRRGPGRPGSLVASPNGQWREKFAQTGVKLLSIRSRAVFPAEFNRLVDEHEFEGAALSHLTLGLVAEVMQPLEKGTISVLCDKHGGRDHYAALLTAHFFDGFVEVQSEGPQSSTYRFGPPERRVEFQFRAKAESCLPAALASMASKYLRELAMEAFNAFWTAHIPDLSPTAGYPLDAKRFRTEIAAKVSELGIAEALLWRKK